MYDAFQAEVARLVSWVKKAQLVEERQVLWCLARLPDAYKELSRTYESRYAEDIARHQQAALTRMGEEIGPSAGILADKMRGKFLTLNERFGLPALAAAPRRPIVIQKTKRVRKSNDLVAPA